MGSGVLDFPCGIHRLPNGNTLIADAGNEIGEGSEVIEVAPQGDIVWSYGDDLSFAHSAERLAGGSTLITDTTHNRVLEVDSSGSLLWQSSDWDEGTGRLSDGSRLCYPNDAHAVDDETVLITDRNNDRCVLVSKRGRLLRSYQNGLKRPHNADILPDGNVIIADSDNNRVVEFDSSARVVWSYGDRAEHETLNWPRDADRLPSGNTLICDSRNSRLIEVSPAGALEWTYQFPYFANPYEADVLPDGSIIVADQQHHRVVQIDRSGSVVWEFCNAVSVFPVNQRLVNGFFRAVTNSGEPEHWNLATRFSEGGGAITRNTDDEGKPFVTLEYDRTGALYLVQVVKAVPGLRYRLGASIRAEGIAEGSFAALQLAFRDANDGLTQDASESPKGRLLAGNTDWIDDAVEAVAPENASSVEVRALITGPGRVSVKKMMMLQV